VEWDEVKTLVVGTVQPPVLEKGEWVVQRTNLSYFSRLTDAESFTRLATVETHRREVERAGCVCGVMDGAVWEQGSLDVQRKDAIRILDFPHATEYLTQAEQVVHGEDTPGFKSWLADTAHELKHGSPDRVLDQLRAMEQEVTPRSATQGEIVQDSLNHLEKPRAHMEYAQFQAAGYPIGSGAVESGNKVVVEARLKGAGMHWARPHVNPMLALRNMVCSDRWEEAWPEIERRRRQQDRQMREQRRQRRRLKRPAVTDLPQSSRPAGVRPVRSLPVSHPAKPTTGHNPSGRAHRPADNHPLRHSPIGRAIFLPRKPSSSARQ
jgi:hypothetical protein